MIDTPSIVLCPNEKVASVLYDCMSWRSLD